MNAQDTAAILALFGAAYPNANVSEPTALVWAENLIGVDPDVGLEAARTLIRTTKWFPSVSEFIEHVGAAKRAHEPEVKALPEAPLARSEAKRLLAAARDVVSKSRQGPKHWHAGPDPCPRCVLIPPPFGQIPSPEVEF